ncbi:FolC bifunctional protein [Aureobasidium melanogenum CBS 110374]|uniref:FolC bifunctional protein n=1 Tax=Aureobasidium melanogenum (strain CBS 110374) TaxID=1043003 RepID=A0A074VHG7_AURM1|nr:FolC bifunctional protein [Aureobasidium melanogenum CBS 110374]KEQ59948.1 FolC bifunctional protein [Aureobasidium melanogenum CBS 110374]
MIELGLARVFRLLARTPLPWRALHVAGTNGKGSICAYISAMLAAYNASQLRIESGKPPIKHGRFTSPHLIDRWDCITIDEKTISEAIFRQVEAKVLARNISENIQATEFELLTATAFEIFTLENVDIGVIEVGMGGRLDSTNILGQTSEFDELEQNQQYRPKPLVTAISTIALDHQGFLGNTLVEIATQKAGIMKPGVPLILAMNDEAVTEHILQLASEAGVTQILHSKDAAGFDQLNRLPAPPTTQAACGSSTLRNEIRTSSLSALASTLRAVPQRVVWPGRLQDIDLAPLTNYESTALLDGAHNVESATVLANTVRTRAGDRPVVWILAASRGKDLTSMFELLLAGRPEDRVVATEFGAVDGMPWITATQAEDVKIAAVNILSEDSVIVEKDVGLALERASRLAEEMNALLVIAGSLYLVGDVLRLVRNAGGAFQ